MKTPADDTRALKKLSLILLMVVLLPALFYSGYELNSLSNSEELIGEIYRQQLNVILFSVNQFAWDVTNSWASTTGILVNEKRSRPLLREAMEQFLERNPSLQAVVLADTLLQSAQVFQPRGTGSLSSFGTVLQALRENRAKIERLNRFRQAEYRKIEPIEIGDTTTSGRRIALVFSTSSVDHGPVVVGLVLDDRAFVRNVLSSKLSEAAGDEFILAVLHQGSPDPVYATDQVKAADLKQQKELWLFPNYSVGIRLRGETIDELVRDRFYRNMALILILDVVLLGGVLVVYRSIRREMDLVRLKSDFVSNVSHELRTPLALIRMFGETLEMGRIKDEEKKKEYYSTIVKETERLTRLVNNILNFSRMEAGKKQYQFRDVQLNRVVNAVLETYSIHLQHEGFTPVAELADGLPPISADDEALTESLINILDNAVKYSNGEKYLRVRTGLEDGSVFVEVEDRGVGISPQHQEKIFETFYRISTGLVHNTKGSGLGLALVRHIMEAHGGRVTVQSTPGKGSTFRLIFPRKKSER